MKIAILSDSINFPTGFSNQAKLLSKYFHAKGHEVHFFANGIKAYLNTGQGLSLKNAVFGDVGGSCGQFFSNITLEDGTDIPFKVWTGGNKNYFEDSMSPLLKHIKPDAFIILLDTFMLYGNNAWFNSVDCSPAQTFFWFPSDGGGGMPVGCDSILRKVEVPVAMAEFGKKQVKDYHNIVSEFIPHGTEPKKFFRLPESDRLRLKAKYGLVGKFVIGVVARNQPRKMLDRTIKTMYFLKDKLPNAVLFLHLDPMDPAQIWYIPHLISRYGLENKVVFSGMSAMKGFDWSQMNDVYNTMDVFYLSTSGEGFGIPIIEAMAAEVPVIATDYTTTPELVIQNNAGLGAKLSGTETIEMFDKDSKDYDLLTSNGTMTGSWEVERGLVDVADACDKICYLEKNPELRVTMGLNGRKAVLEKYDFETVVGPMWEKLLIEKVKKI